MSAVSPHRAQRSSEGFCGKWFLKQFVFLLARALPSRFFFRLRDAYARAQRSHWALGFYLERVVNFAHRRLLTRQLLNDGVAYFPDKAASRYELYHYVVDHFVKEPVDYLEFGVAQGASMEFALQKFSCESHCYGFDSFEGLPDDWCYGIKRGAFAAAGLAPSLTAANLTFVTGWFEESLEPFLLRTTLKPRLVLHMDADLYEPTIFVLRTMKALLVPGTVVIFDEYWFLKDEFRALQEFSRETGKTFRYLAISDVRAAIQFRA